jgi:uncharacterized membrane protein YbhN (UPF0104 family)
VTSLLEGRIGWIVRGAGLVLTLVALLFVGIRIVDSSSLLATDFTSPRFITALVVGAVLYALFCGLISLAWVILVRSVDRGKFSTRDGLIIFARSQILKYLPSNVLHFVGRYGMAHAAGASHTSLIFATATETALLLAAASAIAVSFALPLVLRDLLDALGRLNIVAIVLSALGFLLICSLWWLKRRGLLKPKLGLITVAAFGLYLCFFLLNGTLLWVLASSIGTSAPSHPWFVLGVAAVAWLGGFVVPGAPAGLGIREAILTSGLSMAGLGPVAISAALGYRIVTLGGDVIVAMIGYAFRRRAIGMPRHSRA